MKVLRRVGTVTSALALFAVIAIALSAIVVPKIMGAVPYTVLSGSMRPAMEPGDLAIVRPVDPASLAVGDVVTFQVRSGDPTVITHRVIGVGSRSDGERTFVTQGDANDSPDPGAVRAVQVRGAVAYSLPLLGHVNSAITSGMRSTAVVVAAAAVIGYGLWLIGSDLVRRRGRGAEREPPVETEPARRRRGAKVQPATSTRAAPRRRGRHRAVTP